VVPRLAERYGLDLDGEPLQASGIRWSPPVHSGLPNVIRGRNLAVREALNQSAVENGPIST
jgi:hypothetical protein